MKTVTCARCGNEFDTKSANAVNCPDCRPVVRQEQMLNSYYLHAAEGAYRAENSGHFCACGAPIKATSARCPSCYQKGRNNPVLVPEMTDARRELIRNHAAELACPTRRQLVMLYLAYLGEAHTEQIQAVRMAIYRHRQTCEQCRREDEPRGSAERVRWY